MAKGTYAAEVVILGKTKLGEADCIVRMLGRSGELIEAVAKGARKPSSVLSAQLEPSNRVQLLLVRGSSLDLVKESRLISSSGLLRTDPAYAAAAACVCEFAAKAAQKGLEMPRFFDLTIASIDALGMSAPERICLAVAAYLLKAAAMLGSRPSLAACVVCGEAVASGRDAILLSLADGGVVCEAHRFESEVEECPSALVEWAHRLLLSRFADLAAEELTGDAAKDARLGEDVLSLATRWVHVHFGIRLKSARSLVQYCAM